MVFRSSESSYNYRPRITYQYTLIPRYEATVSSYYDHGYSVYYGETNAESAQNILSYMMAVKSRYMELLALHLDISTIDYYASPIDICKGTVTSENIDTLCTCKEQHTERNSVCTSFRNSFPGDVTTKIAYWTGHRIQSESNGMTYENRSCSQYNNIYILKRNTANRWLASTGVLMHELNHQFGAPDHYHELINVDGNIVCKNKSICSVCGDNPRPKSCIMYNSLQNINNTNIICDGCLNDMKSCLNALE